MAQPPGIPVRVRPGMAEDLDGIRMVATMTWTATYRDVLTPANIGGFLAQAYRPEVIAARIARPRLGTLVAEYQMPPRRGIICGYAFVGPHHSPDQRPAPGEGELYALYVVPEAQGQGAGYALWQEACAWLRQQGFWLMWVGVLAANDHARAFYDRQGAQFDHVADVVIGTQTVSEAWYRLPLAER